MCDWSRTGTTNGGVLCVGPAQNLLISSVLNSPAISKPALFLRHDTLQRVVNVIFVIVPARRVNQSELCAHLPGTSSIEAKKRRAERGCRDPQLTESVFLAFLLALPVLWGNSGSAE